jgi:CobQ-like glutamine amidotransferase family enzyme
VCGGFQIIGREWLLGDEVLEGLGLIDMATSRGEGGTTDRILGDVVLKSLLADMPVIGYENHAGRTVLGPGLKPFGTVVGGHGTGNSETAGADGVLYKNAVGTYLHGPVLAKNPGVADALIERALLRRAEKQQRPVYNLAKLDDTAEIAANEFMRKRLHVRL